MQRDNENKLILFEHLAEQMIIKELTCFDCLIEVMNLDNLEWHGLTFAHCLMLIDE